MGTIFIFVNMISKFFILISIWICFCLTLEAPLSWCGALQARSVVVVAKVDARNFQGLTTPRLVVLRAGETEMPDSIHVRAEHASQDHTIWRFFVSQLEPEQDYQYSIVNHQRVPLQSGNFTTPPEHGVAKDLSFVVASCAETNSNHLIFRDMAEPQSANDVDNSKSIVKSFVKPSFYINTGDLSYEDIEENSFSLYAQTYEHVFRQSNQRYLYNSMPIVYMWDDHDFGPNNSDETNPGKVTAPISYRTFVPHYPLTAKLKDISQSFQIGRVLFIVSDMRTHRSAPPPIGRLPRTIMSEEQVEWFKALMQRANDDSDIDAVFWVSGVPWIDNDVDSESDTWSGFDEQRRELAVFVHSLPALRGRVFMLCGDMHATTFDDGSNNVYHRQNDDDTSIGFPVFHAAAIDKLPTTKGGPYSHGCLVKRNQYGWVRVLAQETTPAHNETEKQDVCVEFYGVSRGGNTQIWYNTCHPELAVSGDAECESPFSNYFSFIQTWMVLVLVAALVLCVVACVVCWCGKKQRLNDGKQRLDEND